MPGVEAKVLTGPCCTLLQVLDILSPYAQQHALQAAHSDTHAGWAANVWWRWHCSTSHYAGVMSRAHWTHLLCS